MAGPERSNAEHDVAHVAHVAHVAAERLTAERDRTLAQIDELTKELSQIIDAVTAVATDDEHDPEGPTIAFERAQAASILDQARHRLSEIDHALRRVEDGVYGICEQCGRPIGSERLEARPPARTCIDCASKRR